MVPASPASQVYGASAASGWAARSTLSTCSVRSRPSLSRTIQVMSAPAGAVSSSRSSSCGTSNQARTGVPAGSRSRIAAAAGSAVSSAYIQIASVPAGGWKRTDLFSATAGPIAMIRRPVTARPAQREAGEASPCSTKSMSTSSTPASVRRCSRTV